MKSLSSPLDDEELTRLDDFLLDRMDDESSDRIDAAGGDEGILDVAELDGLLTAVVSGPNVIVPSKWLPAVWGAEEPTWESVEQFQEIFQLFTRHQNSIAHTLLHQPDAFEPMFTKRKVKQKTYVIVDELCLGYMRGIALDDEAWRAGGDEVEKLLQPIKLWGTEEGWDRLKVMSDAEQERERNAIAHAVRALHKYWLERREPPSMPVRRTTPKVGRNDPCPCGSGKKYKQCCLQ
jgi:uncharacterized protein